MARPFILASRSAGFDVETWWRGVDLVVVRRDGSRVRTIGFRVFTGDERILEPYVEALTREQRSAQRASDGAQ
jgi:hypothetical protein